MASSKNKKKYSLIILLVALAILIALLLLLKDKNKDNNIEEESEDTTIAEIDISKIKEVSYENEYDSFKFTKNDDGTWVNAKDSTFPLEQANLNSIENNVETINYSLIVSKNPEDLSEYGLDEPVISAIITMDDGTKTSLKFGIKVPVTDGYYAMINNDSSVYVISNNLYSVFNKSKSDILTIEELPSIGADSIGYVKLTSEDKVILEMKYNKNETIGLSGYNNWQILQPYDSSMEASTYTVLEYLEKFGDLSYSKRMDYKTDDLAQYGLDNPSNIIYIEYIESFSDNDGQETQETSDVNKKRSNHTLELHLGVTNEKGDYYAKTPDSNSVHIIGKGIITDLVDVDPFRLLEKGLTSINIETVDSIKVRSEQEEYVMEIKRDTANAEEDSEEGEEVQAAYYIDDVEVEEDNLKTVYQYIIKPRGEKLIPEDYVHDKSDTPLLWVTFNRNTKEDQTVDAKYYIYDDNYCVADINGDMIYVTDRRIIEEVIQAFE